MTDRAADAESLRAENAALRRRIAELESEAAEQTAQLAQQETKIAAMAATHALLAKRQALLEAVLEGSSDAIYVKDLQGRYCLFNRAAAAFVGKRAEEVIGRDDRSIFPEAEALEVMERDRRAWSETLTYEETVTSHDGRRATFLSTKGPVRDAAGNIVGIFGIARDVTERKRAEEALRASEEKFRKTFTTGLDAFDIVTLDEGRIIECSDMFLALFGYEREEVLGKTSSELGLYADPTARARVVALLREQGGFRDLELTGRRKNGEVFIGSLSASVLQMGDEPHMLAVMRDISEHKRAEEALRESDRRKSEFIAVLSHELRNPLAPIRHSLYILEHAAPGGEQARRALAVIDRQVGYLSRLVDELLDVNRINRGRIELARERLDLNELVLRTVEDHRSGFVAAGVQLEVLPAAAEIWVNGDPTRLAQVIGNLLQNAVRFTPRGGKTSVSVAADAARGQATLQVADTGRGIAPEMLPRLFEAFTQADTALDRSKGGLGLGLALVKGLVELHGGSVSAASGGSGQGATFTVMLPLEGVGAYEAGPQGQGAAAGGAAARRVLIIEDNADAAETLREALEFGGHTIAVAYYGPEGLATARSFRPDVVLCDIGLPGMDGYQVAQALRADPELGRATLIALTGYAQPEDVAKAKEVGFDAHLAKPLSMETIEELLVSLPTRKRAS